MQIDGTSIPELLARTFREPRAVSGRLIRLGLGSAVLWEAFALVVVLNIIATYATMLLQSGGSPDPRLPPIFSNPMMMGFIQACLWIITVFATHWVGRAFGGRGEFEGALVVVTWLQFVLFVLQIAQTLAIVVPQLAALIAIFTLVVSFWLMTQFICELHGFEQPWMVFLMIIVTSLMLIVLISFLLAILGVASGMEVPNV